MNLLLESVGVYKKNNHIIYIQFLVHFILKMGANFLLNNPCISDIHLITVYYTLNHY